MSEKVTAEQAVSTVLETVQDGFVMFDLIALVQEMFPHLSRLEIRLAINDCAIKGPDGLWRAERRVKLDAEAKP